MVLINHSAGKTYSEILELMKREVTPEDSGTVVRHIWRTVAGGYPPGAYQVRGPEETPRRTEESSRDKDEVRSFVPVLRVEILDLDTLASEANVITAVERDLPTIYGTPKATLFYCVFSLQLSLSRLIGNVGGLRSSKRRLLLFTINAILL